MARHSPEDFPFRLDPGDFGTPTRLYARRGERGLDQIRLPSGDLAYFVLDHAEVDLVLKDRRFSRDFRYPGAPRMVASDDLSLNPDAIVNLDPPEHTRLRRTVQGDFRHGHAAQWRPVVGRIVGELLDAIVAAGPPADLVADYALLLPVSVMCELLDIPAQDRKQLIAWTGIFFVTAEETARERGQAGMEFFNYVKELVAARREVHGAGLVDSLIRARDVDAALSEDELLQMIAALLIGGQENTSATLARGIFTLLRHRDWYAELCAEPQLVESAVEEILRFEVPSEGAFLRVTTEDVELPSGVIPKGSAVQVSVPAANRDGTRFEDPERFDIRRQPNPHLTFGVGAHFCIGAPLARLELQVAIAAITERLPGLRLAVSPADMRYAQDAMVRPLLSLPVDW